MSTGMLAALGATSVAAAYLNAKFHIKKDIDTLRRQRWAEKQYANASKKNKLCLWYLFEEQVLRGPAENCIWSRTGCYTRLEVYQHCCRYANWFLSQGVVPGHWVALYHQNCPDFMFVWLALWAIGCAPALINYNLKGEALLHSLQNSGSSLVLVDPEISAAVLELQEIINGELNMKVAILDARLKTEIGNLEPKRPDDRYRAEVKGSDNQALIYTSGTSGKPKGVPHTVHHGYLYGVNGVEGLGVGSNHRWYQCMPLYHGTGGMVSIICLMDGTPLCIGKKFSASQFWNEVRASRSTCFTYVGETVRYLLAAPVSASDRDHGIRAIFGNGLRPDVWTRFRDRFGVATIVEFFGSSEGVFGLRNSSKGDFLAGCVGHHGLLMRYALRNTYVPVAVDATTGELHRSSATGFVERQPYSVGGEILVRIDSEAAFPGYYKDPAATAKRFARDVFVKGDLWYRTGDALRRTSDGKWLFLDRLGDTFRWKSENVSTAEVSEVLGHYPGIMEANVYGVSVPGHEGRAGCAALTLEPAVEKTFDFGAFHKYVEAKIPRYAVPVFLRLGQGASHTHNNKQNKAPLKEEGVDPAKVNPNDRILWRKPGSQGYTAFTAEDWSHIVGSRVRL